MGPSESDRPLRVPIAGFQTIEHSDETCAVPKDDSRTREQGCHGDLRQPTEEAPAGLAESVAW